MNQGATGGLINYAYILFLDSNTLAVLLPYLFVRLFFLSPHCLGLLYNLCKKLAVLLHTSFMVYAFTFVQFAHTMSTLCYYCHQPPPPPPPYPPPNIFAHSIYAYSLALNCLSNAQWNITWHKRNGKSIRN